MWPPLRVLRQKFATWMFCRSIGHALALNRAEGRRDGLTLVRACNRLEVQWRARRVHPWDRDLSPAERARTLEEQSLSDAEAAILRLFEALPQVDVVDLTVLDHSSDQVLMAGTVQRSTLDQVRMLLSVRMRLQQLGISYRFPEPT